MAETRREFFDRIAREWDGWVDLSQLEQTLRERLGGLGVEPDGTVIDLGCGTGNLTRALLERLGPDGRVLAVDFSPRMLAEAERKVSDSRVQWLVADAAELPVADGLAHHVFCFSAWPHFPRPSQVLAEVRRVLRPQGELCIWHEKSRTEINQIHARAGAAVERDFLPPARELAALAKETGLDPFEEVDSDHRYMVRARPTPARMGG